MKQIITININRIPITAEVDTGCPIILIGAHLHKKHFANLPLQRVTRQLLDASGNKLVILGSFSATLAANNRQGSVKIIVQVDRQLPLLGTEGLDILFPKWRQTFVVNWVKNNDNNLDVMLDLRKKFHLIFDENFAIPIKNVEVDLHLKPCSVPVLAKARPIPYGLRETARSLINDLVNKKVIQPVEPSDWASPIVFVKKPGGGFRLCIDPSRTLNPCLQEDHYPLPTVDDMLVEVGGHKLYSVIDLTGAFQQLQLTQTASKLVTIATPFGFYEFLRLPFGIKTASAVFQRVIDHILKDLPWAKAYIDDIIFFAESPKEMTVRIHLLFEKLSQFCVKVNLEKCVFAKPEIHYLGHVISEIGLRPSPVRVKEILDALPPHDVKSLQSFLGLISYIRKFLPQVSPKLAPLFRLLEKGVTYCWEPVHNMAFEDIKLTVASSKFLVHYDTCKELFICTDASDFGIAAVLCHLIDGDLRPIMFKSRTLIPAEKNYPILHRELLAVVYGCEEFY